MGFRTIIITSRAKLEHRLNYLIIRKNGNETKIYIPEISVLIIQSTAVALTTFLVNELCKNNVKIIFCDEKANPQSEIIPYYGAYNTTKKYKLQINWNLNTKKNIWQQIIKNKIEKQASFLNDLGYIKEAKLLYSYITNVEPGDITNREGHAAKVYFNCLLGKNITRRSNNPYNSYLNYGYSIILSEFNRDIVSSGYLTQLGIWHDNEFNPFNLSSDLMEPFRVLVDRIAFSLKDNDKNYKYKMIDILNYSIEFENKTTTVDIAIRQYTRNILHALEEDDLEYITFPTYKTIEKKEKNE